MIRITLFNSIGDVDKLAFTPDNLVDITWDDELIQTLLISNRSQFKMADAADDATATRFSKCQEEYSIEDVDFVIRDRFEKKPTRA